MSGPAGLEDAQTMENTGCSLKWGVRRCIGLQDEKVPISHGDNVLDRYPGA